MTDPIRPEFELVRDFMPVLVASKFDENPIKMNALAWRHRLPIISLWEIFRPQEHLTPLGVNRSGRNLNSSEILCLSSLPASLNSSDQKQQRKSGDFFFSITSQWALSFAWKPEF